MYNMRMKIKYMLPVPLIAVLIMSLASMASACTVLVHASARCYNGIPTVNWFITTSEPGGTGTVTDGHTSSIARSGTFYEPQGSASATITAHYSWLVGPHKGATSDGSKTVTYNAKCIAGPTTTTTAPPVTTTLPPVTTTLPPATTVPATTTPPTTTKVIITLPTVPKTTLVPITTPHRGIVIPLTSVPAPAPTTPVPAVVVNTPVVHAQPNVVATPLPVAPVGATKSLAFTGAQFIWQLTIGGILLIAVGLSVLFWLRRRTA